MSLPQSDCDWLAYQKHRQAGGKDKDFAAHLGIASNNMPRWKKKNQPDATSHSAEDTALHSADLPSLPDTHPTATVQTSAPDSAETLVDHETRLQMLEGFMAALQAQARQPAVQQITVHTSADSAYALHSAESVQTWDTPEDAKPERWNLWLPHGLKRRIEAQARAAGIAPSSLVQRLLMAAVNGQGGNADA